LQLFTIIYSQLRIPMKPAGDSDVKPIHDSDAKPVTIGAKRRWRRLSCKSGRHRSTEIRTEREIGRRRSCGNVEIAAAISKGLVGRGESLPLAFHSPVISTALLFHRPAHGYCSLLPRFLRIDSPSNSIR